MSPTRFLTVAFLSGGSTSSTILIPNHRGVIIAGHIPRLPFRGGAEQAEPTHSTSSRRRIIRNAHHSPDNHHNSAAASSSETSSTTTTDSTTRQPHNTAQLFRTLSASLDKFVLTGSPLSRQQVIQSLERIEKEHKDDNPKEVDRAVRMIRRAGLSVDSEKFEQRKNQTQERKQWEETNHTGQSGIRRGRSALTTRTDSKVDHPFMGYVDSRLDPKSVAEDKQNLERELNAEKNGMDALTAPFADDDEEKVVASARVSNIIAQTGAASSFDGQTLGIGGLDDVLSEVRRRVWIPLAAPPQLLRELGIQPVRGILLYGKPGCGKTLLARRLGQILSPMRPYTLVSGPEVLDKFVGSSEKNLRNLFDNPPDIYDKYRLNESDGGKAIERAALHVIIMDEFDAIARTRGGRGGSGDQGDAGVARDSVVNQLLAKMDGVDPLPVPTMVIGLTNKRSLVDPALLRPGRFEVQIEVPPPRTLEQRVSILRVHTRQMFEAGRLLVTDAPSRKPSSNEMATLTYEKLLLELANKCEGFSGAALAGVARAAASHALERTVENFASNPEGQSMLNACVVTEEDFDLAVGDVQTTMSTVDFKEDEEEDVETDESSPPEEEEDTIDP